MTESGFQLILGNGLLLRDFVAEDLPAYFALRDDDKFQRFYPEADRTQEKAAYLLDMFIAQSKVVPRQQFQLAIVGQELMGSCGLRLTAPGEATMGCELGRRWHATGAAKIAAKALLDYGFGELGLQRVLASTIAENRAALRLCRNLGMRILHEQAAAHHFKHRDWTEVTLVLDRQDWQAAKL